MRPRPTLLVIEDEPLAQRVIEAVAKRAGFDVHKASTGAEAEAAADSVPIDFIIVDLHLPDAKGFELIARLHGKVQLAGVPFVVCTGDVTTENVLEARQLGAMEFMRKPIDLFQLQRRLEKCLDTLTDRWIPTERAGLQTSQHFHQQADTLHAARESMAATMVLLESDAPASEATITEALKGLRDLVEQAELPRLARLVDDLLAAAPSALGLEAVRTALRVGLASVDQLVAN